MNFSLNISFGRNKSEQRSSVGAGSQASSIAEPQQWLLDMMGGGATDAGVTVNKETAMRFDAVFSCIKVLSETLATLPLGVYLKTLQGREAATNHPTYQVIKKRPNPLMTSYHWMSTTMVHLCTDGNSYSRIIRNNRGEVVELSLFESPQSMYVTKVNNELWYKYPGIDMPMHSSEILHFAGMSFNGIKGLNPIAYNRSSIGLGIAQSTFAQKFYGNGANMSGILESPSVLNKEAFKSLKDSFNEQVQGLSKSHNAVLLNGGVTYKSISVSPADAQYIEGRKLSKEDICGIFRVPPHMIASMDKATFSNIEQQSIDFITRTMTPWVTMIENELDVKLFSPSDAVKYYTKFNLNSSMRGDATTRANYFYRLWLTGAINADEIRELEDMNQIPDGGGQKYFVPVNVQDLNN